MHFTWHRILKTHTRILQRSEQCSPTFCCSINLPAWILLSHWANHGVRMGPKLSHFFYWPADAGSWTWLKEPTRLFLHFLSPILGMRLSFLAATGCYCQQWIPSLGEFHTSVILAEHLLGGFLRPSGQKSASVTKFKAKKWQFLWIAGAGVGTHIFSDRKTDTFLDIWELKKKNPPWIWRNLQYSFFWYLLD